MGVSKTKSSAVKRYDAPLVTAVSFMVELGQEASGSPEGAFDIELEGRDNDNEYLWGGQETAGSVEREDGRWFY